VVAPEAVFFAEKFWSPRHFARLSHICIKLAVTVFVSQCFQPFWPKWLNFFRSFQKHFGLWPKKQPWSTRQTGCYSLLPPEKRWVWVSGWWRLFGDQGLKELEERKKAKDEEQQERKEKMQKIWDLVDSMEKREQEEEMKRLKLKEDLKVQKR